MAVAEITNLTIEKGTNFEATFYLFNPDDSNISFSLTANVVAYIAKYPSSSNYTLFSTSLTTSNGTVQIRLNPEQTSNLVSGRNYFEVSIRDEGFTTKFIKGTAMVEDTIAVGIVSAL